MTDIAYRAAQVDGLRIFYREAGAAGAPKLLLLHGFPTSSHMFRDLIPRLADRFHIIAPDLPGFGWSGPTLMRRLGYDRYGAVGNDWAPSSPPNSGGSRRTRSPACT